MSKVVVEFTAEEARLWRAQQRLIAQEMKMQKGYDKVAQSAKKAEAASVRSSRKAESGHKRAGQSVANYAAGLKGLAASYISVQAAVQIYTEALQNQQQVADEAKDSVLGVAKSHAAVIKNLGPTQNKAQQQAFLKRTDQLRADVGFESVTGINMAASGILSATAGDQDQTMRILKTAAPFFRDAPEQMNEFGQAMNVVTKATGNTDTDSIMALMLAMQGQARFTTLGGFKAVGPALQAGQAATAEAKGTTSLQRLKQSGALFAGLGSQLEDADATLTKGLVTAVESNLRTATGDAGANKSSFERLQMVWADTTGEMAKKALSGAGYRGPSKLIAERLFKGKDSPVAQAVLNAFGQLEGTNADQTRRMAESLRSATPELAAQFRVGKQAGLKESFDRKTGANLHAELMKMVEDSRMRFSVGEGAGFTGMDTGFMQMGQKLQTNAALMGTGGVMTPELAIGTLKQKLLGPTDRWGRELSSEEVTRRARYNEFIMEQIRVIQEMRDEMKAAAPGTRRAEQQAEQRQTALSTE